MLIEYVNIKDLQIIVHRYRPHRAASRIFFLDNAAFSCMILRVLNIESLYMTCEFSITQIMRICVAPALAACIVMTVSGCGPFFSAHFSTSVDSSVGTVTRKGISCDVIIRRDSFGIPCIEASNEADMFFGAGYAMASDRLWQMVIMKMAIQGRLAEIAGDEGLSLDIFMRSLDIRGRINPAQAAIDQRSREILEHFARGVNAYIETHPSLPPEFSLARYRPEPWKPEDSMYVFAMLNLGISYNIAEELNFLLLASRVGYNKAAYLFPVYPDEVLPFDEAAKISHIPSSSLCDLSSANSAASQPIVSPLTFFAASNNWALAGSRTKSGKPIIANDTHLVSSMPNSWMMLHLKCPTYDAAGVAVPGVPVINLGTNGSIAWGATMVMADSQDLFIEKLRTVDGNLQYLYKGTWRPAIERNETFHIRNKTPVIMAFYSTVHGPLIDEAMRRIAFDPALLIQPIHMQQSYGISLSWAMEKPDATLAGFYDLAKARSLADARNAMLRITAIYLNLVYGGRSGIAWQVTGSMPIRKKGRGLLPSPGWNGEYDWAGFLSTEKNPHAINPPEGFLATANNRTVPKDHPYTITSSWYGPERRERLYELLPMTHNATVDDTRRMQADVHSLMARKVQDVLFNSGISTGIVSAVHALPDTKEKSKALEALRILHPNSFDAEMTASSAPAAVYAAFLHTFVHATFLDELGPESGTVWEAFLDATISSYGAPDDHLLYRDQSPFYDDIATPAIETKAEIIARSLAGAITLCEKRMGTDRKKWSWGTMHAYRWSHEISKKTSMFNSFLNRGPYSAGGEIHTLNVSGFACGKSFNVAWIPAMRFIVDFGLDEPAYLISVPGQSGNPSSPHYDDMIPYFLAGTNHPLPFSEHAIRAQYDKVLTLRPSDSEF